MKVKKQMKLEMCQYDTDAPTQGHTHPHSGMKKMKQEGHDGPVTLT